MPKTWLDRGYLVVSVRHLLNKNGTFFYQRRIPSDLQHHYGQKTHIRESLKTRDIAVAAKRIGALVRRDDALWLAMRRDGSLSPPVITHDALALLKAWEFELGVKREWYEDDFHDKMLEKYGADYYDIQVDPGLHPEQRDEAIERLITPSEREAHRLINEDPSKPLVRLSGALAMYLAYTPRASAKVCPRNGPGPSDHHGHLRRPPPIRHHPHRCPQGPRCHPWNHRHQKAPPEDHLDCVQQGHL